MQEHVPSADDYVRAFMRLKLTDAWLAMLKAHAKASNRTVYVTDLSKAAGYKTGDAANLQYGLLARKVGDSMGFVPRARTTNDHPLWSEVLAHGSFDPQGRWTLCMRSQVAHAVEKLGLI